MLILTTKIVLLSSINMAPDPNKVDGLFWNYLIFVALLTSFVYFCWEGILIFREKGFAIFYSYFVQKYNRDETVKQTRKELFGKLAELVPSSSDLTTRNPLRILEIGAGPGSNFEYYPPGCRVTIVEPNAYFEPIGKASIKKHPSLVLEKWIKSPGENMIEVESESMDAVFVTHVLCSAYNVPKVLKEVQRVLVPGGKYYFMEHVAASPNTFLYLLQCVFKYTFWKLMFNCNLLANSGDEILKAGFSSVDKKSFSVRVKWPFRVCFFVVQPHIVGVATK